MNEYHKIHTVFKRDPVTKFRTLLEGEFSLPAFEYLRDNLWTFTEKIDGTNIRVMYRDGAVIFGGKTDRANIPAPLGNWLKDKFTPELLDGVFDCDACLYGEGYGAGIQKGGNYSPVQQFVLFDVKVGEWWLQREAVVDVSGGNKLDLLTAPVVGNGTLDDLVAAVRDGFYSAWGIFPAEGIVARPTTELCTRGGDRIITKLKTKDFADDS